MSSSPVRRTTARCGLAVAVPLVLFSVAAGAADGCAADAEPRDRWNRVPLPATEVVSLVQLDEDPCALVAADRTGAWASDDGGATWRRTYEPLTRRTPTGLFAEGMGPHVFLAFAPDPPVDAGGDANAAGVLSADGGRSFEAAQVVGGTNLDVLAAAGYPDPASNSAPDRRQTFLLTRSGRPSPGTAAAVYSGATSSIGSSLSPLPSSAALRPTALAVDPVTRGTVWVNEAPARDGLAQLWRTTDGGGTWSAVTVPASGDVADVTFATQPGAGGGSSSVVLAAGGFGVVRSVDGGATWQGVVTGRAVTGVRAETNHGDVLMAIVDGVPYRGRIPAPLSPANAGLPAGCAARGLRRDAPPTGPATFLLACDGGGFYRYRSSGADLDPPGTVSGSPSANPVPTLPGSSTPPSPPTSPTGLPVVLPMTELKRVALPGRDAQSGNIALLDGVLYYTDAILSPSHPDHVVLRRVDAVTGAPLPDLPLRLGPLPPGSFTGPGGATVDWVGLHADSRRRLLYLETYHGAKVEDGAANPRMLAFSPTTRRVSFLWTTPRWKLDPDHESYWQYTYDAAGDQFVAGKELGRRIRHVDRRTGGFSDEGCEYTLPVNTDDVSTTSVLSAGDGGFYVELEDDATLLRLDARCRIVTAYSHRTVSEAGVENDAMACDASTFGVPALWIRDGQTNSATAYAIPFGYCPPPGPPIAPPQEHVPQPHRPDPPRGQVPPPPAPPGQQPIPQPNPHPQPNPNPQVQPQPQPQPQGQQQLQPQSQPQPQVGVVRQRQEQKQLAGVQAGYQQEQYAISRAHRRLPVPIGFGGAALVMAAAYGFALARSRQSADARY